jgi:hypothetical protein
MKMVMTYAGESENYGTGYNLLKHYVRPNGTISTNETNLAMNQFTNGKKDSINNLSTSENLRVL